MAQDNVWTLLTAVLPTALAVFSAAAAAWAAWESRRSANASRAAVEAQLVKAFMDDYFLDDMSRALRCLQQWKAGRGDGYAAKWLEGVRAADPEATEVDGARRRVKGFFEKAVRLYQGGLVKDPQLHSIAYVHGLNVYYDVVIGLEEALNPGRDRESDELLQRTLGRYLHGKPKA